MRALIDTNILIDYMSERVPFFEVAHQIITAAEQMSFDGCIAAHSIPDIFYILRKSIPVDERREVLRRFCEIFEVIGIDKEKLLGALADESFMDFEDCLQSISASEFRADHIVTRNPKDFAQSAIPALTPDEFSFRFLDGGTQS